MVGGEPDYIANICCRIKSTMHDFHFPIFEKHEVPRAICAGENFFYVVDFLHDENV